MKIYSKADFQDLFPLSDDVYSKVEIYHDLLVKWQKAINLVSPKTIPESWHRHFIDSAQMSRFIPEGIKIYADLGCGGGYPGLVLAIMHPELDVHLVESDERKGQFMRTVIRETAITNATVHTSRIENITQNFVPDFITARALASLEKLFVYCMPWVDQNNELQFCFMKGIRAEEEIAQAQLSYDFDFELTPSITDPNAQIIAVKNLCMK